MTPKKFQQAILKWFDSHGRKDLPWQENKTPYRVWVSEIMLQQTQVSTVIPYFKRFMQQFPTIQSLAEAEENEVLHLWTGLGYYSRARNLHRTAQKIINEFEGIFPDTVEQLETCPGIGRSTAGAIISIAFQKKAAILDGNVKRVLARFLAIDEWPGKKNVEEQLWKFVEKYTPDKRTADYTQAIMDLGATLCTRTQPQCEQCPLQKNCRARELNLEKKLPLAKPRTELPVKQKTFLIFLNQDKHVLLEQKPAAGIWGNLWSFPEVDGKISSQEIKKISRQKFLLDVKSIQEEKLFRHTFSHFHLDIIPVILSVEKQRAKINSRDTHIWYSLTQPKKIGLPAPIKKILEKLSYATHDFL